MKHLIGDYQTFIKTIVDGLREHDVYTSELAMMDHLCYRVATMERYDELLKLFSAEAELLGEADVSGRLIATFEFVKPLEAAGWRIPYLELPQPKDGSPYGEGLEHVELVVIGGLERFQARHADVSFDVKGMNKLINPELSLKTDKFSVKFHEQPLGAVVRIEQRLAASHDGK